MDRPAESPARTHTHISTPPSKIRTHDPSVRSAEFSNASDCDRRAFSSADNSASDILTKNVAKHDKRRTYAGRPEAAGVVVSDRLTCVLHATGNTLVSVALTQSEIGPCYEQLCDM